MLPNKDCPGCEKKFRPFYRDQIYCDKCRNGDNEYERDCGEFNYHNWGDLS